MNLIRNLPTLLWLRESLLCKITILSIKMALKVSKKGIRFVTHHKRLCIPVASSLDWHLFGTCNTLGRILWAGESWASMSSCLRGWHCTSHCVWQHVLVMPIPSGLKLSSSQPEKPQENLTPLSLGDILVYGRHSMWTPREHHIHIINREINLWSSNCHLRASLLACQCSWATYVAP